MKIEELGEIGLIERIVKKFRVDREMVTVGAGDDDCAVIDTEKVKNRFKHLVITTDTLQESTHFPHGISPFQIGWSIVAVNLSDVAAMGAYPFAFTIAMGIPAQTETAFLDGLVAGIEKCAATYNTAVVGGDTTMSKELILTGTCFGFADRPVRRAGAKVGDLICVTGSLGNAALALKLIGGELKAPGDVEERIKKALFQPVPRINEGITIANSGVVTSMIDISDGLALSLAEIAKKNSVGAELYEDKVPVLSDEIRSDLRLSKREQRELAYYFGGDYELLFTIDAGALENEEMMSELIKDVNMSVIGKIVPQSEGIYTKNDGAKEKVEIKGYQHF
ncbi:thiamine-monophosphate kinase [Methanophagales archaeon]|nr:thiamine-monophosphate kinase [Methanophagales archaeon]